MGSDINTNINSNMNTGDNHNANEMASQQTADYLVGRRQLYILPTRIGWYYALILIALFELR